MGIPSQRESTYEMTEFSKGIVNAVTDRMDESIALAVIFFVGHILIAATVVTIITGASHQINVVVYIT